MKTSHVSAAALAAALVAAPAAAQDPLGLGMDLAGSLGERGGWTRYVPPVTQFVLNETPFITTELKPVFLYHNIPDGFITDGGRVIAGAVQGRLAINDRFAIIATTDGYADIDFDEVLPDTDGFLDLTAGVKYALISDPAAGNILTAGLRYVAPVGNIETGGIDLNGGSSKGYVNGFLTGAKIFETGTQVQAAVGYQAALDRSENWSFVHLHVHVDHEVSPGFYPLIETNFILPTDGGQRIPGASLTGADVFDIGASDPDGIVTFAAGARYRFTENVIAGGAFEANLVDIGADEANSVYGWRITTDLTIHF